MPPSTPGPAPAHSVTAARWPTARRPASCSGTPMATSIAPASAMAITGWPGLTTCPGSADDGRDDAGLVGGQRRIAGGVGGLAQLRLRRLQRRDRRVELVAPDVVARLRDELLGEQRLGPLQVGACHVAARACAGDGGLGAALGELEIRIVEARDHLADLDAVADIDGALNDLAADTKGDAALDPGPDDTGVGERAPLRRGGDDGHLHRPHQLLLLDGRLALAAGRAAAARPRSAIRRARPRHLVP